MINRRGFIGALLATVLPTPKPIVWKNRLWVSNYRPGIVPLIYGRYGLGKTLQYSGTELAQIPWGMLRWV